MHAENPQGDAAKASDSSTLYAEIVSSVVLKVT
jgi:hypothetical protein